MSALILGGKLGKQRERAQAASFTPHAAIHKFKCYKELPVDMQLNISDYLDFVDFSCLIVTCKFFSEMSNKDDIRWQLIRRCCVENRKRFVARFSSMHSWYKHITHPTLFTFTIKPGVRTKWMKMDGSGDVENDDHMGRFGLHFWDMAAGKSGLMISDAFLCSVELNCYFSRQNISMSNSCCRAHSPELLDVIHSRFRDKLDDIVAAAPDLQTTSDALLHKRLQQRLEEKGIGCLSMEERLQAVELQLIPPPAEETSDWRYLAGLNEHYRLREELIAGLLKIEEAIFATPVCDFLVRL